jgi:site-specific recombinase XerD
MKLIDAINSYVTLQQSKGMSFGLVSRILGRFSRNMGDLRIDEVRPQAVADFLQGTRPLSATWLLKYRVLSSFYRFAISRGYISSSPLPTNLPKLPPQQTPYVYSNDELHRLIEATSVLHVAHSRLQAPMYRTLLILLYGSGLRIGEALGLTLRDVDLLERILTVRRTKFFKTRLVPIGPRLAQELATHVGRRQQLPMPAAEYSPLFTTRTGNAWPYQHVITLFQRVRRAAHINCLTGEVRPPRLHDLRHTAAVHRVLAWYRSGKDVQRLLPQLATYLGHVNINSTQRYLQMTPELLEVASQRFALYSQLGGGHE